MSKEIINGESHILNDSEYLVLKKVSFLDVDKVWMLNAEQEKERFTTPGSSCILVVMPDSSRILVYLQSSDLCPIVAKYKGVSLQSTRESFGPSSTNRS